MKNDKSIHLGNGFIYDNDTIKESDNEDSQRNQEWLTHEECWKWVAYSLKKIYKVDNNI